MDKLHTWVRYRDESWYIGKFENDKSELWDALDTTTEYADDKEIYSTDRTAHI